MTKTLQEQICELDAREAKGAEWLNNNMKHPQRETLLWDTFIGLALQRNELENSKYKQGELK